MPVSKCRAPNCDWKSDDLPRKEAFAQVTAHNAAVHPERTTGRPPTLNPDGTRKYPARAPKANAPAAASSPIPAYLASFDVPRVLIDPVVHLRYRTWVEMMAYGKTFTEFLDECTEIVTRMMGLVPAGYYRTADNGVGPSVPVRTLVPALAAPEEEHYGNEQ